MALDRKDVRAKLDPDLHEALTVLCEIDQVDIGEFIERELLRVIKQRVHDASETHERTAHLGITGNRRESAGIRGSGREKPGALGSGRR